jgi:ATP phosphoribosyltransferase regulatory subunit
MGRHLGCDPMTPDYAPLRALFADAGYPFVEPPVVHPASVFVDLLGEDLRRRLYLTSGVDGTELALRPDYTIPVALHHLATGEAKRKANYAYIGPVFRIRDDGPGEFLQAGVESLGRTDRLDADADVLRLAFAAAATLGLGKPKVRIGDSALFAALLDALDLNAPWRKRLARAFGDAKRLKALIPRSSRGTAANGKSAPASPAAEKSRVRRLVETRLAETGLATVGGRTAEEIAERAIEKQALALGIGARAAAILIRFLAIAGTPAEALADLAALASEEKLDLAKSTDRFAKRAEAFVAHGIDDARLTFAADFGRRLDYYTGFVFEFDGRNRSAGPLVGGGRYDRMMAHIPGAGARESVPAVGFSIWLDRIGPSSPSSGEAHGSGLRPARGQAQRRPEDRQTPRRPSPVGRRAANDPPVKPGDDDVGAGGAP